jgi:exopolyphosphatase/guanosine-5'-triphosphate,3'-diphosphate pyrophosphatase
VHGNGPSPPHVVAAIDAGTNSVHLLVAEVVGGRIEALVDEKAYVGLGPAVERGELGPAGDRLVEPIGRFATLALERGAERIAIVGTEPLRRVGDAAAIAARIKGATGLDLDVVSHEEEGLLTLLGVTLGTPVTAELLVADVGGGSAELVFAVPGQVPTAVGLRLGSARLVERLASHDPPTRDDLDAMTAAARLELDSAPHASPAEIVAVGGAATNLLAVAAGGVSDDRLDGERIAGALDRLLAEPADAAAARFGIDPARARVLPAGAAILLGLLGRYDASDMAVSSASVREGIVFAMSRSGPAWRADLPTLARGIPTTPAPA